MYRTMTAPDMARFNVGVAGAVALYEVARQRSGELAPSFESPCAAGVVQPCWGPATLPAHEEGGHEGDRTVPSDSKLLFVRPVAPSYVKPR